jgi:hypothetical protein
VTPEPPSVHGAKTKSEARLEAKQDQLTQPEEDKLSRKQRKQGAGTDQKPNAAITSSEETTVITVEEQKQVAQVSASREQLLR